MMCLRLRSELAAAVPYRAASKIPSGLSIAWRLRTDSFDSQPNSTHVNEAANRQTVLQHPNRLNVFHVLAGTSAVLTPRCYSPRTFGASGCPH
eukprot:366229-Chlamydomonas_euryale.AAC.19